MTTSFRKPFTVMKRAAGYWQDGFYHLPNEQGTPTVVYMTIQMARPQDMVALEPLLEGRRRSRVIRLYTDTRLNPVSQEPNGNPGDLVLYDGSEYLIIGEADYTFLKRTRQTPVSHFRYYAAETIEHAADEVVP
jgi:hypothetical protein